MTKRAGLTAARTRGQRHGLWTRTFARQPNAGLFRARASSTDRRNGPESIRGQARESHPSPMLAPFHSPNGAALYHLDL